jgi:hypothetical protein
MDAGTSISTHKTSRWHNLENYYLINNRSEDVKTYIPHYFIM